MMTLMGGYSFVNLNIKKYYEYIYKLKDYVNSNKDNIKHIKYTGDNPAYNYDFYLILVSKTEAIIYIPDGVKEFCGFFSVNNIKKIFGDNDNNATLRVVGGSDLTQMYKAFENLKSNCNLDLACLDSECVFNTVGIFDNCIVSHVRFGSMCENICEVYKSCIGEDDFDVNNFSCESTRHEMHHHETSDSQKRMAKFWEDDKARRAANNTSHNLINESCEAYDDVDEDRARLHKTEQELGRHIFGASILSSLADISTKLSPGKQHVGFGLGKPDQGGVKIGEHYGYGVYNNSVKIGNKKLGY